MGPNSLPARSPVTGRKVTTLVDGRPRSTSVLTLRLAKYLEDWKPFHVFCRGLSAVDFLFLSSDCGLIRFAKWN